MFIKVDVSDLECLNPVVDNYYDEDIGFSETSHTFVYNDNEITFVEPSSLGYAAIEFHSDKEKNLVLDALKNNSIPFSIVKSYC